MKFDTFKNGVDVTQSIATVIALVAAGYLYFSRYEHLPRADIAHDFDDVCLTSERRLVRAQVKLENKGTERLDVGNMVYLWTKVSPLESAFAAALETDGFIPVVDHTVVAWPELAKGEVAAANPSWIEAGESQSFDIDLLVQEPMQVVELMTFFENFEARDAFGWMLRSLHKLEPEDCS